jgi:hypothetical protein
MAKTKEVREPVSGEIWYPYSGTGSVRVRKIENGRVYYHYVGNFGECYMPIPIFVDYFFFPSKKVTK